MSDVIVADRLVREFKVPASDGERNRRTRGFAGLFRSHKTVKRVVDEVSFSIRKGEFVATSVRTGRESRQRSRCSPAFWFRLQARSSAGQRAL